MREDEFRKVSGRLFECKVKVKKEAEASSKVKVAGGTALFAVCKYPRLG